MTLPAQDIVERLRDMSTRMSGHVYAGIVWEAADTIEGAKNRADALAQEVERLRGALADIADSDDIDNALDPARNKRVARAALGDRP